MSGHPVPNRQRKRLLILTLTATEVKVDSATDSLVTDDANDYNVRNGCATESGDIWLVRLEPRHEYMITFE
jgi:hypothetical protein